MVKAEETSVENTPCLYVAGEQLTRADLAGMLLDCQSLSQELPKFSAEYKQGIYVFIIDFNDKFRREDVTADSLRPWNNKSCRIKMEKISIQGTVYTFYRATHPLVNGLKKMAVVSKSKAVMAYIFANTVDLSLPKTGKRRAKSLTLRDILGGCRAEVKSVPRQLKKSEIEVTKAGNKKKTNETISSAREDRVSPVLPTDLNKLTSAILPYDGHLRVYSDDGNPNLVVIVVFEEALKIYGNDCPSKDQLARFLAAISSEEASEPSCSNTAQFLNGIEPQLSIEKFDLSDFHTTLIVGKLNSFKTKESGEDYSVLLALMLHNTKDAKAHQVFSKKFAAAWNKTCQRKAIPNIIEEEETADEELTKSYNDVVLKEGGNKELGESLMTRLIKQHMDEMMEITLSRTSDSSVVQCIERKPLEWPGDAPIGGLSNQKRKASMDSNGNNKKEYFPPDDVDEKSESQMLTRFCPF